MFYVDEGKDIRMTNNACFAVVLPVELATSSSWRYMPSPTRPLWGGGNYLCRTSFRLKATLPKPVASCVG